MLVHVLLFARAKDLAATPSLSVELPTNATVASLRTAIAAACPALSPYMPAMFIAIDSELARDDSTIPAQTEIALFPPVSGG